MKKRTVAAAVLAVSAAVPSMAMADEVRAQVGEASLPVGPAGTRVMGVERLRVLDTSYAVIRSRDPADLGACGAPAERVSAWARGADGWTEVANQRFDRCPAEAGGRPRVLRARVVEWTGGPVPAPELHVRLFDPAQRPTDAPVIRLHRSGERFVQRRVESPLAARPGEAPRATLSSVRGAVDGALAEWGGVAPWMSDANATVWLAADGSRLRFAVRARRVEGRAPSLRLRLAEPGVSTATMESGRGNAGRALELRCDAATPDATLRCRDDGEAVVMEGSTDLATMLWSQRSVATVAALATVAWGSTAAHSEPMQRLQTAALPAAFDVLDGASPEVVAQCGRGYVGRVSEAAGMGDLRAVTCGERCANGVCERAVGVSGAATRLAIESRDGARCLRAAGAGGEALSGCEGLRLLGAVPAPGYALVAAVEREVEGARRPELWSLVTASARWQRVWSGAVGDAVTAMRVDGLHPELCRGAGESARCEQAEFTVAPAEEERVTASVVRTLQDTGLWR